MILPLDFDTRFFGRRMGQLSGDLSAGSVAKDLADARAAGFVYLTCRPPVHDAASIRTLERAGFYLTDVGVTWEVDTAAYLTRTAQDASSSIREAVDADIPRLSTEAMKLFKLSRFYSDPFFTAEEADRLHAAWLENSVKKQAADAVFIDPACGFVTCRITNVMGEVILIGVWDGERARGVGRSLMTAAMSWFSVHGAQKVHVKTQVKNLRAMNFYHRLGFDLHAMDMTMACILSGSPGTAVAS